MSMNPPRQTIYKGMQMRSRLEAGFAGWLDRMGLAWQYEPYAVGDEHGQYLPDFVVEALIWHPTSGGFTDTCVEIKPTVDVVDWPKLQRAAVQILAAVDMPLVLITPGASSIITDDGAAPLVWVHHDEPNKPGVLGARLALAPLEAPFDEDWWT